MGSENFGILWLSNSSGFPTGYGNQTKLFTPRIKQAGYEIAIAAFAGREGFLVMNDHGIPELPRLRDHYMNDIIGAHLSWCKAQHPNRRWFLFSLIDPFVLNPDVYGSLDWSAWCPIDSAPVLPASVHTLKASKYKIAMSKFGETQLKAAFGDSHVLYVPHGIETDLYKPIDRNEARKRLEITWRRDLTDKFLVIDVAANKGYPSRKNFDGLFRSFAAFAIDKPNALLYVHTETKGIWQGEDLQQMVQAYGIADKVIFPDQYLLLMGLYGENYMNDVYNVADVFFHAALGEGFGIPSLEAQSAGCPVILPDNSAQTELCLAGDLVPCIPYGFNSPSQWGFMLSPVAAQLLEKYYKMKDAHILREKARERALAYDVDTVMQTYMLPVLAKITRGLNDNMLSSGKPRTTKRKHKSAKRSA